MRQDRPTQRFARLLGLLVAVALLLGVSACGGKDEPQAAPGTSTTEATPTTSEVREGTLIATARVPDVVVLADPPPGVDAPTTTTTAPPPGSHLPIPRVGLNSAGVSKVPEGYRFDNPTYFDNPLVMQVLEDRGEWLKVLIQARPNHTTGWVKASDVELSTTTYRMVLSLADRHLTVYDGDEVVVETDVVIGKDTTPTPLGEFFLSEKIPQSNPNGSYGPWILSTNGYSEALDLFDNGLPVVAFHGTNKPELIGTQASNGCIRLENEVITQLAEMLPAGTPILIVEESLKDAPLTTTTSFTTAA
jgi:lipoprotein-anchoring transpeptidase ErfK/SrfK